MFPMEFAIANPVFGSMSITPGLELDHKPDVSTKDKQEIRHVRRSKTTTDKKSNGQKVFPILFQLCNKGNVNYRILQWSAFTLRREI